MNSQQIYLLLKESHNPQEWAFFGELLSSTGTAKRRLDAWAMNLYQSHSFKRVAYEIKVSRADFNSEMKKPEKRWFGLSVSNEFYFVAPQGLISKDEVPEFCGLKEVIPENRAGQDKPYRIKVSKRAPWRDIGPMSISFCASTARRAVENKLNLVNTPKPFGQMEFPDAQKWEDENYYSKYPWMRKRK